MLSLFGLVLLFSNPLFGQNPPWQGILSSSRAINWSSAGISSNVVTIRTNRCGSTIAPYGSSGSPASPATINKAIAACPSGDYVQLGPGTFYLSSGIIIQAKNNVTLRGMGADQTFLVFSGADPCMGFYSDICVESGDLNWKGGPSNLVNWTSGYAQGTTTITLASVPNLRVGYPIILDQADDTSDSGGVIVCDTNSGFICSSQGNGGGAQRSERNQIQIVTVTGCGSVTTPGVPCSGTNVSVTISPGLYMPNWSASKTPQAWWANNPVQGVGIEDLSQDDTASGNAIGIEFFNALNSWAKGVRGIQSSRAHVEIQMSQHVAITNSYFFLTANSTSTSYGVECYTGSDLLIENNVFQGVSSPEMINGACEGTVVAYNYNILNYYTSSSGYALAATNVHTAGADLVLWEGNHFNQIYADNFHGTHNLDTAFRNYIPGNLPACWISGSSYSTATFGACNNNLAPVVVQNGRFFNFVGNVLGQSGTQTGYDIYPGGTASGVGIYEFGFGDLDTMTGVTVPNNTSVQQTVMLWGNYDTVNAGTRFVASEVPNSLTGGAATFSNPVPGSQTLPASFYHSSTPTWWPPTKPWPAIGPDVSGGNVSGVGGHVNTIPAEDCYLNSMGGIASGAGPVLSFNENTCYQSANRPQPPTNVSVVVD